MLRACCACGPAGDDWLRISWNGMRGAGNASILYFVTWVIIGNFILLTLFLAILITSFQVRCVRACHQL